MKSTKVITGKVRGSYVNVFAARKNELSGEDEYSMMILIPKTDTATVQAMRDAISAACEKKWGSKVPQNIKVTMRDGDAEYPDKPEFKGQYFCTVKSKQMPGIVDRNRQEVLDQMAFMSGDYCRVSLNAFGYDTKGNKGVSFGLNNVQILSKGEALGRARAEDDFDSYEDDGGDLF